jgi:uncharacterized membrane protein YesL
MNQGGLWHLKDLGNGLYTILEWITRFAYLNLLWIVFTLAGAILFGIYPSTTAMFAVMRKWLRGHSDLPVFSTFWSYYKKDFWKSNHLGIYASIIFLFIFIDLFYIQSRASELMTWTHIPIFVCILLFIFLLFYLFPVFAHYDLPVLSIYKQAFLMMLISPVQLFLIAICLVAFLFINTTFPALAFIFGFSFYSFITSWLASTSFRRLEAKQTTSQQDR